MKEYREPERMIAGLPAAHGEIRYRCFLPDLAGFAILRCTGPGYQNQTMAERVRFELTVLAYTRVPGVHLKPLGHLSSLNAQNCELLCKLSCAVWQSKNGKNMKKTLSPSLGTVCCPTIFKEGFQQLRALILKYPPLNGKRMIEACIRSNLIE